MCDICVILFCDIKIKMCDILHDIKMCDILRDILLILKCVILLL